MKTWKLEKTTQCKHCPWRVDVNPYDIPNGYDIEKHKALIETIAQDTEVKDNLNAMCCHEGENIFCIGWLSNQIINNNITLRIKMLHCENKNDIKLIGKQHATFEETIPKQNNK